MRTLRFMAAAALAASLLMHLTLPAAAQNQDYFIPNQAKPAPAPGPGPGPRTTRPVTRPTPGAGGAGAMAPGEAEAPLPMPAESDLPPPPELPPIAKGESPPAAVLGVLGVPEVMRASTAAQAVEKVIGGRRSKLNDDAQKEQQAWRDMQQALANDRGKLTPDQIRARERALQERITNAQRTFRERNRVIQEAAQYALAQIERTLVLVIRQVAESRGMNLVLHRSQVALNVNQFDITPQVAEQLNKVLPAVVVPPEGVSPSAMAAELKNMRPAAATAPARPAEAAKPAEPAKPAEAATPAGPAKPAAAPAQ